LRSIEQSPRPPISRARSNRGRSSDRGAAWAEILLPLGPLRMAAAKHPACPTAAWLPRWPKSWY